MFSGSTAERPEYSHAPVPTGVKEETFQHIGQTLTTVPDHFNIHPTLGKRFFTQKEEAIESGKGFDWARRVNGLGFSSVRSKPVRLSGQDCRRGTAASRRVL